MKQKLLFNLNLGRYLTPHIVFLLYTHMHIAPSTHLLYHTLYVRYELYTRAFEFESQIRYANFLLPSISEDAVNTPFIKIPLSFRN